MLISVIIVNYNTFDLTRNCIQSIIDLTKEVPYEIILVDNASTECDPENFRSIFPNIKLIKTSVNVGFAKGNNLGIENAKGDIIFLLNSDTILIENSIKVLAQRLQSECDTGVISPMLIYPNGIIQCQTDKFPSIFLELIELFRVHKLFSKKNQGRLLLGAFFDHKSVIYPDWFWGAAFMFKREILNLLPSKKLADDFFMYGEDLQWCIEINRLGYKILYLPDTKIIHLVGGSHSLQKVDMIVKNKKKIILKYYGKLYWEIYRYITVFKYYTLRHKNQLQTELLNSFKKIS